jgi:hypothetical protein
MALIIDIFFTLVSYLPKLLSWWLYSPERTKEHVEVSISAQQGSVELWCDKAQSKFSLWIQFKNNNPFPIEIDRIVANGDLYTAHVEAINIIGGRLEKGESDKLHLEGKIDDINLKRVNESPENESLSLVLNAVIINKYHYIRDFKCPFNKLMCKLYNKQLNKSLKLDTG